LKARIVRTHASRLPAGDDHPYRNGAWRPNLAEWEADDLDVTQGAIPDDLDGDGMVHSIRFHRGRASYRNRLVPTKGLAAELAAGQPLFAGIIESPGRSLRDGWGARGRMKDASSTDVVVHAGRAKTSFYQCGDLYEMDPVTLDVSGPAAWDGRFPQEGVSAHTKLDPHTGELLFFNYSKIAPYMHYGVLDAAGALVHYTPVPLPGPRLPHDMAFTERFAILNDCPVFWDTELLAKGVHRARFHRDLPTRFAVLPRRGTSADVRWFEASSTYVLHWINAFEADGEIVLDGYRQADPIPRAAPEDGPWGPLMRQVDLASLGTTAHRWRFDLRTGRTREEPLDDACTEFPTIDPRRAGRAHRSAWAMTAKPGWFLFDGLARLDIGRGTRDRFRWPEGVYGSESPMIPRRGGEAEDDGWVVTFVSDTRADVSECQIFDARRLADGPVACVRLPERISSGTHACWAGAEELGAG
jgi:carotenoid cleavage dioxygenase